jgi:hypothetical protein
MLSILLSSKAANFLIVINRQWLCQLDFPPPHRYPVLGNGY